MQHCLYAPNLDEVQQRICNMQEADDAVARIISGASLTLILLLGNKALAYVGLWQINIPWVMGFELGFILTTLYVIESTRENLAFSFGIWMQLFIGYVAIVFSASGIGAGVEAVVIAVAASSLFMSLAFITYPPRT